MQIIDRTLQVFCITVALTVFAGFGLTMYGYSPSNDIGTVQAPNSTLVINGVHQTSVIQSTDAANNAAYGSDSIGNIVSFLGNFFTVLNTPVDFLLAHNQSILAAAIKAVFDISVGIAFFQLIFKIPLQIYK